MARLLVWMLRRAPNQQGRRSVAEAIWRWAFRPENPKSGILEDACGAGAFRRAASGTVFVPLRRTAKPPNWAQSLA
jgi:hypothetical protein